MKKTVDVVLVKPGEAPQVVTVKDELKAYQELVGGNIEIVRATDWGDNAVLVCNEEGRILELPINYMVALGNGLFTNIRGSFFIVGVEGERFVSLTKSQKVRYVSWFWR